MTPARVIAGVVIVGDCDAFGASLGRFHRLRQPEVEHLYRAVGSHLDVGGLEVAMDDALLMRRFQRLRDLLRDGQCLVDRNRALCNAVGEGRPLDQFHDEACIPSACSRPWTWRCSDDSVTRGLALLAGIARVGRGLTQTHPAAPSERRLV